MEKRVNNRVFQKKTSVVTRKIAGEVILVPVSGALADMQNIFSLDTVGEFIWELIDGVRSEEDLAEYVTDAFDVGFEQAQQDVIEFIDSLNKAGLVSEVG
jgi:hypothetical protein